MTVLARDFLRKTKLDHKVVNHYADVFSWRSNPDRTMQRIIRKARNPWLFRPDGALRADEMPSEKPPVDIQAQFEEVFGRDAKSGTVQIILHPFFKRWTIVQKYRLKNRESGLYVGHFWRVVWMAMDPAKDRVLPRDYQGNDEMEHLAGVIGEYRLPNKLDFIWIVKNTGREKIREKAPARCDTVEKANAWASSMINENLEREEHDAIEREVRCEREAMIHDWCSYYARLHINVVNRIFGAAQSTWSLNTVELKPTKTDTVEVMGHSVEVAPRYTSVKRGGYTVRAKLGTGAAYEIEQEKASNRAREDARLDNLIADYERQDLMRRARASVEVQKLKRSL